jgi:hypothetical protein
MKIYRRRDGAHVRAFPACPEKVATKTAFHGGSRESNEKKKAPRKLWVFRRHSR